MAGIIETGRQLIEAKAQLVHGEWLGMIEEDLPFKPSTAQRVMKVGRDQRLVKAAHAQLVPSSWYSLYELTKLDDVNFKRLIKDGTIRPDMKRTAISAPWAASSHMRAAPEPAPPGPACAPRNPGARPLPCGPWPPPS